MTQQGKIGFVAGEQCAMEPARVEEPVALTVAAADREIGRAHV